MTIDNRGVIVTCGQCGRTNRLAYATLVKPTRCGQCKAALGPPAEPIEVPDAAAFDAATRGALPVLVDDRVVAAVDLKTDRQAGKLLVQKWSWLEDAGAEAKAAIDLELGRFERFQLQAEP